MQHPFFLHILDELPAIWLNRRVFFKVLTHPHMGHMGSSTWIFITPGRTNDEVLDQDLCPLAA